MIMASHRALTMFVGVVALRYQHNSHKHSQSHLTSARNSIVGR